MLEKIRLVEIEIHSYCNRACKWCPNSIYKRNFYKELPEFLFIKVLTELKSHGYKNFISLSRYEEPFSNQRLLKQRISQIRHYLPNAKIVAATNGDFNYKGFDVDELTVMDYDNKLIETSNESFRIMKLKNINNRGGSLDYINKDIRDFPCFEPNYFIGIDYNGNVVPCCNIRSDIPFHKPYVLGNVMDLSLEEILNTENAVLFRKNASECRFEFPCMYCSKKIGRYTSDNPSINNNPS